MPLYISIFKNLFNGPNNKASRINCVIHRHPFTKMDAYEQASKTKIGMG